MEAVERNHPVPPEELMAYLDGELESERALTVHAHLADCDACVALATEFRQTSRDLQQWSVPAPDYTLQAPNQHDISSLECPPTIKLRRASRASSAEPRRWTPAWLRFRPASAWSFTGAAALIVVCTGLWISLPRSKAPAVERQVSFGNPSSTTERGPAVAAAATEPAREITAGRRPQQPKETVVTEFMTTPANQGQVTAREATERGQKIIRTVSMTIVAREFDTVRDTLDRLLRDVGGFVGGMQASDGGSGRSLRATLRVPAGRLDEIVRSLRALGRVIDESQSGQDVTEQVRDIEARLTNSRNTEKRLTAVLENRTGRVSDVLEVEREIARVREEIERMEAGRLNLERQVEYSTVTVQISQQRQATLDLGPTPIRTQLRNAFVEGMKNAYETLVGALVWFLSVGPFVVLWAALLWWPARIVFRMVRGSAAQVKA